MAEFHIKAIAIGKPLALSRIGLRATFFRPCDWTKNSIEPRKPQLLPRSLSSVLLHEALHHYERKKLGMVRFFKKMHFENWKIEGLCEYLSASSSFPTDKGLHIFSGEDDYDFVTSNEIKPEYFYFVSRLQTDYLLNFKKVSESDYWSTRYDENQLNDEIRQALKEKRYAFSVQWLKQSSRNPHFRAKIVRLLRFLHVVVLGCYIETIVRSDSMPEAWDASAAQLTPYKPLGAVWC